MDDQPSRATDYDPAAFTLKAECNVCRHRANVPHVHLDMTGRPVAGRA